jgi:dTDP-glucose 4,6-dehydratase
MQNIIVTGGAGFIGSNFIKKVINLKYNVINIDNLTYASNLNYLNNEKKKKNYFFYKINILNEKKLFYILKKFKPLYIFNFAAETHVDNSIKESSAFIKTNILGTYSLLNAVLKTKYNFSKNFKFINISTDEVFGDVSKLKRKTLESDVYNPSSPYSASKASSDHLVTAWGRTYNIPYNITYSANNYGPNQNKEKFIPVIIKNIINNKKIPIYGSGSQMRDWIYVEDNVDAILKVAKYGNKNHKYNIGAGNLISNNDLVKIICNILIKKFDFKKNIFKLISNVKDRPGHDIKYHLNSSKIRKLGWKINYNIHFGLEKTIAWYLSKDSNL